MSGRHALSGRVIRRSVVRRSAVAAMGFATAMGAAGCGAPVKRAIAGTVTLDGQPLDEAVIMLVPLEVEARKTGAAIKAGRYEVPRDIGLFPGRYRVEIADNPPIDHADRLPSGQRRNLPVVYSVSSPLAIHVTPSGTTTFDFALVSRSSKKP